MLFEMATGNLAYRIHPDDNVDDLSRLVQSLASFAGQFQLAIRKSGCVVPHYTYQHLTQFVVVTDNNYNMIAFSHDIPQILEFSHDSLLGKPFDNILSEESKEFWENASQELLRGNFGSNLIHLTLVSSSRKLFPFHCTVTKILHIDLVFISAIVTQISEITELNLAARATEKLSISATIQSLHDYILQNLDKPLPTLKELARIFQTNEFKLKTGFRHFFNTSIYRFYNERRLSRAYNLIMQTNLSLKSIALMSGFEDYVTFSKAFKKRFGYPPGSVGRNLL